MIILQETYDLLTKFEECRSEADVSRLTLKLAGEFGVEHFLSGTMPCFNETPEEQIAHIISGSWPDEWGERYFNNGYISVDPTIAHVIGSDSPLNWSDISNQTHETSNNVIHEAKEFGLTQGITIPQASLDGLKIGISFSGSRLDIDNPRISTVLTVIGSYSVGTSLRLSSRKQRSNPIHLTPREREILQWVGAGKTSFEIGIILSISSATVEKHIRSTMQKIGANNRPHVIAEAMRIGLLH